MLIANYQALSVVLTHTESQVQNLALTAVAFWDGTYLQFDTSTNVAP